MKALLVIDMLKDFVAEDGALSIADAKKIISNIKNVIEVARANQIPIIYICDSHRRDDKEFEIWPVHCVEGTNGAEVIEELRPEAGDYIIKKQRYSGFFETDLDLRLKELGVEEVILTGVATNICVHYTASDAVLRGYSVIILKDCIAAITPEEHEFGIRQMKEILNCKLKRAKNI